MNFFGKQRGSVSSGPQWNQNINQYNVLQQAVGALGAHARVTEEKKLGPDAVELIWNGDQHLVLMEATTFHDIQSAYRARSERIKTMRAVHDSVSGH